MQTIKDLFDPNKNIDRRIENVVTFADNTPEALAAEIREYVVTDKLHYNYEKVITKIEEAFSDSTNEVGIWVSGFYGSGKSSFAKYLGYSFDRSMLVDGVEFGEKLMNRISDAPLTQLHKKIVRHYKPVAIMIDLSTQSIAGRLSTVSDIMYYETLRLLGITASNDPKILEFVLLLMQEGKYEEFCQLVEEQEKKTWSVVQNNALMANRVAARYAPQLLPQYFTTAQDYKDIAVHSVENEEQRFERLIKMVRQKLGCERVIYVLDEAGQYISADKNFILGLQGTMQILKSKFKGDVWLIATAQQTLTEDSPSAQLNSPDLYKLNDRFPIKVDIEADDIKEIITKRLLGKSVEGKKYLTKQFEDNEGKFKLSTALSNMDRSIYIRPIDKELFANLYPFLPVHIDILLTLLQKLASRTGGVGLRSVIRLIRDILVENHLAQASLGKLAGPDHFYDILRPDMEKNKDFKEIVLSAEKAISLFQDDQQAVRICKTIAVMQLLDDFNLSFDNLCALLYDKVGQDIDRNRVRTLLEQIKSTEGVTLQEIDGRFRFMTNAILSVQEERNRYNVPETEKTTVLKELVKDLMTPPPSVSIFTTKTIIAGVELGVGKRSYILTAGDDIKIDIRFVTTGEFPALHQQLITESIRGENDRILYWICTLDREIDTLLSEIVRDEHIYNAHQGESNKEVQDFLRAQQEDARQKRSYIGQQLSEAQSNSEAIYRGNYESVNRDTCKTHALKQLAEKIFSKYPLASSRLHSSAVTTLTQYNDFSTIPTALNPFGIIRKDGTIDIKHSAFAEIQHFIQSHDAANGSQVLKHFDQPPYGWSKDTTRYLVALMLKAGLIAVRGAATTYKMFTEKAADEMRNNQSFANLGISFNTSSTVSPQELLEATQTLRTLFNVKSLTPQLEAIAKQAFKSIGNTSNGFIYKVKDLIKDFEACDMAGLDRIRQAEDYCNRILETEGVDASLLLSKDRNCVEVFTYVIKVFKQKQDGALIDNIKRIKKRLADIKNLPQFDDLNSFYDQVDEVRQVFYQLLQNPDCYELTADYADLFSTITRIIEDACCHFYTESVREIQEKLTEICAQPAYLSLTTSQQEEIKTSMAALKLTDGTTLEALREMMNDKTAILIGGRLAAITLRINQMVAKATPAVKVDSSSHTSTIRGDDQKEGTNVASEPIPKNTCLEIRRRFTTRDEVSSLITILQEKLSEMEEGDTIHFTIKE